MRKPGELVTGLRRVVLAPSTDSTFMFLLRRTDNTSMPKEKPKQTRTGWSCPTIRWLLLVAVLAAGCGGGTASGSSDGKQITTFAVFLHPSTGETGRLVVEDVLTDVYDDVVYIDQEESFKEFREMFAGLAVDEDLTAVDMPPRFSIATDEAPAESLLSALHALPQVREVATTPTEAEAELAVRRANDPRRDLSIVYLNPGSGEEGKAEVADLLSEIDDIYFVDQEQTLAEFHAFFEGDPESVADLLSADDMPPSWRVDLSCARLPAKQMEALESNRHVRDITNAHFSCLETLLLVDS